MWSTNAARTLDRGSTSAGDYGDWKRRARSFDDLAAMAAASYNLSDVRDDAVEPRRVTALRASANLFPMLGVRPVLGRGFTPAEDSPAAAPVVVLSHSLWRDRFAGDPPSSAASSPSMGTATR